MKSQRLIILFAFFLCLSLNAQAATVTWIGGTGDWEDPANWDTGQVPDSDDEVIITSGIVTVDSYGIADHIDLQGGELSILGSLVLVVDDALSTGGLNAIRVGSQSILTNHGYMVIVENSNAGNGKFILNYGEFTNETNGYIHMDGPHYTGIHNYTNSSFTNRGEIDMVNVNTGIYSIDENFNYGTIDIESIDYSMYVRDLFYNSATGIIKCNNSIQITNTGSVNNYGIVKIDYQDYSGTALNIGGNWTSQNYSSLSITGTFSSGLIASIGSEVRNKGSINIQNNELYTSAISAQDLFVNHQRGSIYTKTSYGVGTGSSADVRNFGSWHIATPTNGAARSLSNNGVFSNRPKGRMTIDHKLQIDSGSTLNNQGHMFLNHTLSHNINGTFNNTGSLNDVHSRLPVINNQSIIAELKFDVIQANVPITDILLLGNNLGASVLAWYTTATGNVSAGSYNSSTNTFTPNSNAIGLSTLYVRTRINVGGVTRRHKVHLNTPVQPLTGSANEIEYTQNNLQNSISLFPNPTTEVINIRISESEVTSDILIRLLDLQGKTIATKTCDEASNCRIDIPDELTNGLYYIFIHSENIAQPIKQQIQVFR